MTAVALIKSLKSKTYCLFRYKYNKSFFIYDKYLSSIKRPGEVTAGILVIGDEILNGQTEDKNTSFLIQNLNQSGIKVKKIVIVPDNVDIIAGEVSSLHRSCTVCLTSGGIGPTHDDVTYEAVAKALGEDLVENEELCKIFENYFGPRENQNRAVLKFSFIPKSAVLNYKSDKVGQNYKFPLISVKNIFMLPGVPRLLQIAFEVFKSKFPLYNKPNFTDTIFIAADEVSITPILNQAVEAFENRVKFGSYPTFTDNYYRVKITLESHDETVIKEAKEFITKQLPQKKIVSFKQNIYESAVNDVSALSEESLNYSLALNITKQALNTYDLSETCICFNGGKDCTALLHLLYTCVQMLKPHAWDKVHVLYVRNGDSFQEIEEFVQNTVKNYNLHLVIFEGDLKTAFSQFLQSQPMIKSVFMGTRRCDPGAELLRYFNPTDADWPFIMRVLPILDWTYSDVWNFIRRLQLPYCTLYDRGYTSLGLKEKTKRNPALLISDRTKFPLYKPAYMLSNDNEERNGRL